MIRTQIYLPKDLYTDLHLLAKKEQKPTAQVIRELLSASVAGKKKQASIGEAFLQLANIGAKGPVDLSVTIDKYLYEV